MHAADNWNSLMFTSITHKTKRHQPVQDWYSERAAPDYNERRFGPWHDADENAEPDEQIDSRSAFDSTAVRHPHHAPFAVRSADLSPTKPTPRTRFTTMTDHHDDDTELPADCDSHAGASDDSLADTMRLMRVAQANGLFADVVSYAASLEGELAKRVFISQSTLRPAAIKIVQQIKELFTHMEVSQKTRRLVDEAEDALVSIGNADFSKAEVRDSTAKVLATIQRTFKATHFS
jgi:hypothetical protein